MIPSTSAFADRTPFRRNDHRANNLNNSLRELALQLPSSALREFSKIFALNPTQWFLLFFMTMLIGGKTFFLSSG